MQPGGGTEAGNDANNAARDIDVGAQHAMASGGGMAAARADVVEGGKKANRTAAAAVVSRLKHSQPMQRIISLHHTTKHEKYMKVYKI